MRVHRFIKTKSQNTLLSPLSVKDLFVFCYNDLEQALLWRGNLHEHSLSKQHFIQLGEFLFPSLKPAAYVHTYVHMYNKREILVLWFLQLSCWDLHFTSRLHPLLFRLSLCVIQLSPISPQYSWKYPTFFSKKKTF